MSEPRLQIVKSLKSHIGERLTATERARLWAGKCPDCGSEALSDTAHAENGVRIGFECDITCTCGFAVVMTPTREVMIAKKEGA